MPDYRDRDTMEEFLSNLEEGDRVYITADSADVGDDDKPTKMFTRGERMFNDTGEVVEAGDDVVVELDNQSVRDSDSEAYVSTEFLLSGVKMVTQWEEIDTTDNDGDGLGWKPTNMPVAMISEITLADE